MNLLLKNGLVYTESGFFKKEILIENGKISQIGQCIESTGNTVVLDMSGYHILPGLIDVHVHFREPGFTQKETIKTGSLAAAHGGYTTVCPMPNLNPTPDTMEHLQLELEAINKDAVVHVIPYGTITKQENGKVLSEMAAMSPFVAGFSDDGRGVQQNEMMKQGMEQATKLDKIIAAHCEVNELLRGGYIHDGKYAEEHGHKGICSESEWKQIARDIELAKETGVKYHVCHISAKESVALIRQAKKDGVDISCETGPHYLVFCDEDLQEDGRFKMNPPLRGKEDRSALIEGILDGTVDMIATDHAPHEVEAKNKGLQGSAMGVVGLETSFAVMYTNFVKKDILTLEKLVKLMSENPAKRFGFATGLTVGQDADLAVFDLSKEWTIRPEEFLSKGHATPFAGNTVFGKCMLTLVRGQKAWSDTELEERFI